MGKKSTTYNVDLLLTDESNNSQDAPESMSMSKSNSKDKGEEVTGRRDKKEKRKKEKTREKERSKPEDREVKETGGKETKKKKKMKKKTKEKEKETKGILKLRAQEYSSSGSDSGARDSSCSDDEDGECSILQSWRYPFYTPSASYRQLDVICGSHQYSICGYTLARSMGCGTRLCSDYFEVAGQLFRVEVYPAGFTADTCKYMSIFLTTPGSINPNQVLFEIAVLDQSGKDRHIVETRGLGHDGMSGCYGNRMYQCGPMVSMCRGIVAALPKFVKSSLLTQKATRYLPRDMLAVRGTVQVLRGWSSAPLVHHHMAGCGDAQMACAPLPPTFIPQVMPGSPSGFQQQQHLMHQPQQYPMQGMQGVCNCGAIPGAHMHAFPGGPTTPYMSPGRPGSPSFSPRSMIQVGYQGLPHSAYSVEASVPAMAGMSMAGGSYMGGLAMDGGMRSCPGGFPPSVSMASAPMGRPTGSVYTQPIASNYY